MASAKDRAAFDGISPLLFAVALFAHYLPALKASNLDRLIALRREKEGFNFFLAIPPRALLSTPRCAAIPVTSVRVCN
jgi:hypothetical protein